MGDAQGSHRVGARLRVSELGRPASAARRDRYFAGGRQPRLKDMRGQSTGLGLGKMADGGPCGPSATAIEATGLVGGTQTRCPEAPAQPVLSVAAAAD